MAKLTEEQLQEIRERRRIVGSQPLEPNNKQMFQMCVDQSALLAHIAALEAERDAATHQVAELTANLKRCTIASRESERQVAALEQIVREMADLFHKMSNAIDEADSVDTEALKLLARPDVQTIINHEPTKETK